MNKKSQQKSPAQKKPSERAEEFERKVERAKAAEKTQKETAAEQQAARKDKNQNAKQRLAARKKEAKRKLADQKREERAKERAERRQSKLEKQREKRKLAEQRAEQKRAERIRAGKKVSASARAKEQLRKEKALKKKELAAQKAAAKQEQKALQQEKRKELKAQREEARRMAHANRARLQTASPAEKKRLLAERKVETERRRAAVREARAARRAERESINRQRAMEREEAKRMKRERREKRGEQPVFSSRRHIAMFAAVCSVFVVFSGVLGASTVYFRRQKDQMTQALNNVYERNFYDLIDNMNNLSVKLSKLMISTGDDSQKYLVEVIRQSDATANNLASVPVSESAILNTMKYVNQLGDFCGYLQKKLAAGGTLSEEDVENIENLYETNALLYAQMNMLYAKVMNGYRFTDNINGDSYLDSPAGNVFDEIQNGSVEYPKLIYDGPFSESVINAEAKLTGDEISADEARAKLEETFSTLTLNDVELASETDGKIVTYNFTAGINGNPAFVQISKKGGHIVLFDNSRDLDNFELSAEECVTRAEEFVKALGYDNMAAVWSSDYNGYVYVNLVAEQNGVLVYPDMLKVKIARDNGEVLGFDALPYYTNHEARTIADPALTALKARQKISSKLEIESERLVLVPVDGGKEQLCYEFYGTYRDMVYFIFADANTGREVNVFRVVDSESGSLLM